MLVCRTRAAARLPRAKDRWTPPRDEEWPWSGDRARERVCCRRTSRARSAEAFGVPPHRYCSRAGSSGPRPCCATRTCPSRRSRSGRAGSTGTFGRTFRDVIGESPGTSGRARAWPRHRPRQRPGLLPPRRPPAGLLTIAVSEKRRRSADLFLPQAPVLDEATAQAARAMVAGRARCRRSSSRGRRRARRRSRRRRAASSSTQEPVTARFGSVDAASATLRQRLSSSRRGFEARAAREARRHGHPPRSRPSVAPARWCAAG